jgi:hypothetical protein
MKVINKVMVSVIILMKTIGFLPDHLINHINMEMEDFIQSTNIVSIKVIDGLYFLNGKNLKELKTSLILISSLQTNLKVKEKIKFITKITMIL